MDKTGSIGKVLRELDVRLLCGIDTRPENQETDCLGEGAFEERATRLDSGDLLEKNIKSKLSRCTLIRKSNKVEKTNKELNTYKTPETKTMPNANIPVFNHQAH